MSENKDWLRRTWTTILIAGLAGAAGAVGGIYMAGRICGALMVLANPDKELNPEFTDKTDKPVDNN